MHGDSGFTRTGNTLYDDIVVRRLPDDIILLFLDRRNDLTQYSLLVFGKIFSQQIVIRDNFRIEKIKKSAVLDLIGTF